VKNICLYVHVHFHVHVHVYVHNHVYVALYFVKTLKVSMIMNQLCISFINNSHRNEHSWEYASHVSHSRPRLFVQRSRSHLRLHSRFIYISFLLGQKKKKRKLVCCSSQQSVFIGEINLTSHRSKLVSILQISN